MFSPGTEPSSTNKRIVRAHDVSSVGVCSSINFAIGRLSPESGFLLKPRGRSGSRWTKAHVRLRPALCSLRFVGIQIANPMEEFMSTIIIHYTEFLQFSCFTEDPAAMPRPTQCAGMAFFVAISIRDVTLTDHNSQFFLNPGLIFPASQASPAASYVGQPLSNYGRSVSLLLAPAMGFTFSGSGQVPMLIFRRVEVPSPPGTPTQLSYEANPEDVVVFAPSNPRPIPTANLADPSSFQNR